MPFKMLKHRLLSIIISLCALMLFSACSNDDAAIPEAEKENGEGSVITLSAEEAKAMMEERSDFVLLDVRTEEEFAEGHIPGAVLIPHTEISSGAEKIIPEKEAEIFVYCRSGRRSRIAAEELCRLGYKKVYDFGGIIDWPFEIE